MKHSKAYYRYHLKWYSILFLILIAAIGFIGVATKHLDYNWHFDRIPDYFLSLNHQSIRAPADGQIKQIINKGKRSEVIYTADDQTQYTLKIDSDSVRAEENEWLFEGDSIGTFSHWQFGPLALGLLTTLWLSIAAGIIGLGIAFFSAFARINCNPCWRWLSTLYVELIRGTPLLVQLFIAYFFVGTLLNLNRYIAGLGALALFSGAYFTEILRAGIQSIPKSQVEAAYSLGLSHFRTVRFIVLPQALKNTLPALAGQFINLVKDSSLVSVIAIADLTKAGRDIVASTFSTFEVWFSVAALYLVITLLLSRLSRYFENKWAIPS